MNFRSGLSRLPRRQFDSHGIAYSPFRLAQRVATDPAADVAWGTIFHLRTLLVEGRNVNGFLSHNVRHATDRRSRDGLLWHYDMYHLHLHGGFASDGFAHRSDDLLPAILAPQDAYLVDLRRHPPSGGIIWAN